MKKGIALFMSAALMLGAFTACGSDKDTSGAAGTTDASGASSKISVGYWDTKQQPMMEELVAAYTKENPNVSIELQLTPYKDGQYWTKLETGMTGGNAPDVFWINALHAEDYASSGMLLPLDDAIAANDLKMSDFPESIVSMYTIDDKQYAVPKDFDTNAVWYNKDLFDAAGVEYPKEGWTWEEMVATAEKLNDSANGVYGIAAPLDFQTCYYNTVFAAGGWILNADKTETGYNDPKTQEGIQCWIDLIDQGLSPSIADLTDTSADALFESGRLAMVWAGSYMTAEYLGNDVISSSVDVVELPTFQGKEANVINGLGYAVYGKTKNEAEATKFATWLGSAEAMKIQGEAGAVISARNDAQHYFADAYPEMNMKAYTDASAIATPLPVCKVSAELYDLEAQNLKLAYAGETTLKEACEKAATACDAAIAKSK